MDSSLPRPRAHEAAPRVLTTAFLRAGAILGQTRRELARIIGVSEPTLSRASRGRHLDPASKPGELAALYLRMFRGLDALLGGDAEACRRWLHAPNAHLAGTPAELLASTVGLVHVVEYLDAVRGKM